MKKTWRPLDVGYIVLYALVALAVADALFTLYGRMTGSQNPMIANFALWSYLIAAMGLAYGRMYWLSKIEISGSQLHFIWTAYIQPPQGEKRAFILYRQGSLDMHQVNKRIDLNDVVKYGFSGDLGFSYVDKLSNGKKNRFMPVEEVAFLLRDGTRTNMNLGSYSPKKRAEILTEIHRVTGLVPVGKLREEVKELKGSCEKAFPEQLPAEDGE